MLCRVPISGSNVHIHPGTKQVLHPPLSSASVVCTEGQAIATVMDHCDSGLPDCGCGPACAWSYDGSLLGLPTLWLDVSVMEVLTTWSFAVLLTVSLSLLRPNSIPEVALWISFWVRNGMAFPETLSVFAVILLVGLAMSLALCLSSCFLQWPRACASFGQCIGDVCTISRTCYRAPCYSEPQPQLAAVHITQ